MKSYLLVTGDFVKTGGMDRANFALADYLARQGQQLHLVAHRVANELLAFPNVKFHHVPKVANSYLFSSPLLKWIGRCQAQRLAANGGRVLVNGGNCQWGDANWVHYVHAAYRPNHQAGLLRQCKGSVSRQMFLDAERKAFQSARVIIVNSDSTKRELIEKLEIPEHKLHVVYYGIDPQIFYPATQQERTALRRQLGWATEKPIVVFIGALGDRRKGFDTLFAAWQQLCASPDWDADLIVIGVGAELKLWQQRAVVAGISSRIHFLGFRSDVANLLRAADCLVAPTRYEAYGLGVHEALCCGLPAIVSATAGVAERYSPQLQDLLISDPEDAAELAERLQKWWRNKHHYNNLVSSLSQKLRDYTWNDMAKSIVQTLENTQ
ncbi:MAG: glycosyltransferase family 4 protein [Chlorogloeopsis fritschii C42_A2020_084]|uniref:glycosyltransferase family 4 protein n=1 Tax=Chlorogloeopsis fritschii TaxID=1124 RepID=UPI0019DF23B1|nr:glycosyltransferase family 4 protein [Chlorogloeopsis fritschii]MBF2005173.1 glycosyltransferase family 4 protein [Chlorogloeopsis fritschii C42_A2020_084]